MLKNNKAYQQRIASPSPIASSISQHQRWLKSQKKSEVENRKIIQLKNYILSIQRSNITIRCSGHEKVMRKKSNWKWKSKKKENQRWKRNSCEEQEQQQEWRTKES